MIYSTTLDAAFRVTLELSFGQTGRHCHLLEERAVWENKRRVNHRELVIGQMLVVSQSQAVWHMSEPSLGKRRSVEILAGS